MSILRCGKVKLKKQAVSVVLSLSMMVSAFTGVSFTQEVNAAEQVTNHVIAGGKLPEGLQNFKNIDTTLIPKAHGTSKTTFLNLLQEGNLQLTVYYNNMLYIMIYSPEYKLLSGKTVSLELPIWGGFHNDGVYNYVVCGQKRDDSKSDGGEVCRIIKYDNDFNRLSSFSVSSRDTGGTSVPFSASNVSIASSGDKLFVYTGHVGVDGHQRNTGFSINTTRMDGYVGGYDVDVSHDFRQIVKYAGDDLVFADLSDGHPVRSVFLHSPYGGGPLIRIPGDEGYNQTNAEVSGLEVSDSHYLVTGTYLNNSTNNVYVSTFDKKTKQVETYWLTNTTEYEGEYGIPHLLKISNDKYIIYWPQKYNNLQYVIVNGKGEPTGQTKTIHNVFSSDCEPICVNGKVVFAVLRNGNISFVNISDFEMQGEFELENQVLPEKYWNGETDTNWFNSNRQVFNISTEEQLAGLAELVNSGNDFEGKKINLLNDLYLNEKSNIIKNEWIPIGKDEENMFNGIFNGNGFSIYNAYVDSKGGLFGYVASKGVVKAVNVCNGNFMESGSVTYKNEGKIMFCNNYSLVYDSGGICDRNSNLLYGCKNYGTVKGSSPAGICRWNDSGATISSCSNCGIIYAGSYASGIVDVSVGFVYDCYNVGVMSGGEGFSIFDSKMIHIHGIGVNNSNRSNAMSNCYVSYVNGAYETIWNAPIAREDISNCYVYDQSVDDSMMNGTPDFTYKDIESGKIVDNLNSNLNSILPGWMNDTENINGGLPITIADYYASKGIYKMIPEMWGTPIDTVDEAVSQSYELYFCELPPIVEIEDNTIASLQTEISDNSVKINVIPMKKGKTNIIFNFQESENNCAFTYKMPIIVSENNTTAVKSVSLSKTSYTYNGKVHKPTVTVKDRKGRVLKNNTDYIISFPKGMKNVGRYVVTVKFKGNYKGTVKKTFDIVPKGASVAKVTAKKKGFTIKWKKQSSQTTGYEISYSTSSKFSKKNTKTLTVKNNKTTSKSVSKLKANKKYYVKIRTYKIVKTNGKNVKLYSGWSKVKTVKTKN